MKSVSIGTKTLVPIVLITFLGIMATVVVTVKLSKYLVINEIRDGAIRGYKDTVLNALTTMMLAGNIKDSKRPFIEQMNNIVKIKMIRTDALDKDYGKGNADEYASDSIESDVIKTGWEKVVIDGENIRGVYPYIASRNFMGKDCLGCHNVREGEVLGAVSITVSMAKTMGSLKKIEYIFIALGVLGLISMVFIFTFTFKLTHQPLVDLARDLELIASGDLKIRFSYDARDEVGRLSQGLNHMVTSLKDIITEVKDAADAMSDASTNLKSSSGKMANDVVNQAERTTQVATSIEEMSQTVSEIARSISDIATSASNTVEIARKGSKVVEQTVNEVKKIDETVRESASLVESLGNRSNQIGDIVKVIKDIADQTNLLALNAAIEAARAGEQGRGFAVVADEVRKLAEKTSKATTEISTMITTMQGETGMVITSMHGNLQRVNDGVSYSTQAGKSLEDILSSVTKLQELLANIASASDEMNAVADNVTKDIETIAMSSRDTTVCTDVVSQASSHLVTLSKRLREIVSKFSVGRNLPSKLLK
ncbi:methyl-accepting chemotaxis sensory transducer [Candidatus Magnetobacterium bavaricum]|uniref:Methyl-accepting chemotaxis sensory transducer n=1 Tax=Candidatus Magnetobacterium bavaricum TaxID=29290 RepID=A0A0F3GV05_9BACT|nr:methyl-accepting chemotaxis sensory transducer [Candidatus Magnetobacterium bavaricum]